MMTITQMKYKLKSMLTPKRYKHSLGVMDAALQLATKHDGDTEKVVIAALLHDCARNMETEEIFEFCKQNGIEIDEICRLQPYLLHGFVGAVVAKQTYGITDETILNAIRYHTLGRENMSLMEKIVFIADYIEVGRDFPGVDDIRKAAFENIDDVIVLALDTTIKYVISKGELIHPDAINARNYILRQVNKS